MVHTTPRTCFLAAPVASRGAEPLIRVPPTDGRVGLSVGPWVPLYRVHLASPPPPKLDAKREREVKRLSSTRSTSGLIRNVSLHVMAVTRGLRVSGCLTPKTKGVYRPQAKHRDIKVRNQAIEADKRRREANKARDLHAKRKAQDEKDRPRRDAKMSSLRKLLDAVSSRFFSLLLTRARPAVCTQGGIFSVVRRVQGPDVAKEEVCVCVCMLCDPPFHS